ncbi:hypothetical protein B0H17DRAFT_1127651 [Mycena rosella]|uniref:Uncharacterized protein n=1 Tax=Mycena rosella TaxID=1033263 RepID=A0AAD7DZN4_MYCRO|nr:hypothetical protein B0H17DRAFT_1127651 [Mycena rosella]
MTSFHGDKQDSKLSMSFRLNLDCHRVRPVSHPNHQPSACALQKCDQMAQMAAAQLSIAVPEVNTVTIFGSPFRLGSAVAQRRLLKIDDQSPVRPGWARNRPSIPLGRTMGSPPSSWPVSEKDLKPGAGNSDTGIEI